MNSEDLIFPIIVATLLIIIMVAIVALLLIVNSNRRQRHRAELAEVDLQHEKELRQTEREATRQTLTEVGRELHDNVGQILTVAQMGLRNKLEERNETDPILVESLNVLDQGINEVRKLGRSLNTDNWNDRTLLNAMEAEAERIERLGKCTVLVNVEGELPELAPDAKTILYRSFQEIISNALRHSSADLIKIDLKGGNELVLAITDNGKGIDMDNIKRGSGLQDIERRCSIIGYSAELNTSVGNGCCWVLSPQRSREL